MIATIYSGALNGSCAFRITIEVSISKGLGYQITGLAGDAIKESLTRIGIALEHCGFRMPRSKLVINLAPAHIHKSGTAFDLPIALGILLASGQLSDIHKLKNFMIVGELGLDGSVHPVKGTLIFADHSRAEGYAGIIVPKKSVGEASLVGTYPVYPVEHLKEAVAFILSDHAVEPVKPRTGTTNLVEYALDYSDIKGQQPAKRAMEIVAAGGHHCLLMGAPGIGKTSLAKRLPTILPSLSSKEAMETTKVYSLLPQHHITHGLIYERPFRVVHATVTEAGMTGGGKTATPGEISLAHNGVLFLDELPEFKLSVIDSLRQPLENRRISVSRSGYSVEFPAAFILVASMNPCLCGYLNHPHRPCTCSKRALYWYRRKISGPLLDRIDLHIPAEQAEMEQMCGQEPLQESSCTIRGRVLNARRIQVHRFKNCPGVYSNAQMNEQQIETFCRMEDSARRYLLHTLNLQHVSPRGYHSILKTARTIADLAGKSQIALDHVAEAIYFRGLDNAVAFPAVAKKNKNLSIPSHFSLHAILNGQNSGV